MLIPKSNRPMIITCDYRSGTGYGTITRGFLKILHKDAQVDFRLLPEPELFKRCITSDEEEYFDKFILGDNERHLISDDQYIYFRLYPPRENPKKLFNIGYTMIEGYTVAKTHAKLIDDSFDLILVPSQFVKTVLSQYMNRDKIMVAPPGIDVDVFNITNGNNRPDGIKFKKIDFEHKEIVETDEDPRGFKFTSNATFCHRKGVDLVLQSYFNAFDGGKDEVALILFWTPENPFVPHRMNDRIFQILNEIEMSEGVAVPPVYIFDGHWKTNHQYLPYTFSDCFLFPSRGEGFGLPVLEAGACATPVICPRHTGLSEFVTYENAFVIDVDQIDDIGIVEEQYNLDTYTGKYPKWARDMFHHQTRNCYFPIMESDRVMEQMVEHMRYVFSHPLSQNTVDKGQKMYELATHKYNWNIHPKESLCGIFESVGIL